VISELSKVATLGSPLELILVGHIRDLLCKGTSLLEQVIDVSIEFRSEEFSSNRILIQFKVSAVYNNRIIFPMFPCINLLLEVIRT
jgi:predicted ATP-dependent serine protease